MVHDDTEGELAAAVWQGHVGRRPDRVAPIPQIGLNDAPPAEQFTARGGLHVAAEISFVPAPDVGGYREGEAPSTWAAAQLGLGKPATRDQQNPPRSLADCAGCG